MDTSPTERERADTANHPIGLLVDHDAETACWCDRLGVWRNCSMTLAGKLLGEMIERFGDKVRHDVLSAGHTQSGGVSQR